MPKHMIMRAIKQLMKGMEENTLMPSEYILIGELLEWHRQQKVRIQCLTS